ncbi:GNAT family protein [Clostridium sp.]|uniref:GNAT family N-acetyltransferase n=1 Tax=Clostridium sp. TaxID=1506 RepID=UPI00321683EC
MKILETERLILRPWRLADLDDFYEYAKNTNVGPNAGWQPHENKEKSLEILESFIEKNEVWAIVNKKNNKVIGSIGNHGDKKRSISDARMIGYVLSEDYWGKGIMSEVVEKVIKHLFEDQDTSIISIYHYPHNARSRRVIEKCGFKYEGTLRMASEIYDGSIYDDVCYSMTREDYIKYNFENAVV